MKTISILGTFSNADLLRKDPPVLYKMMGACLERAEDYRLEKVVLLYGISSKKDFELTKEETFLRSYEGILKALEERFPSADLSVFEKPNLLDWKEEGGELPSSKGTYLYFMQAKEKLSTYSYYRFFSSCLASLSTEAVYFNAQSGNVQCKEAMQLVELSCPGESFLFNQSFLDRTSNHQTDRQALPYFKDKESCPGFTEESALGDEFVSRVDTKEEDEKLAREAHANLVKSLLQGGKFLEARREVEESPFALGAKKREALLSYFADWMSLPFDENNSIPLGKVADYYFSRLAYLEAMPETERGSKRACSVFSRLLYVLFHLECSSYVKKEGDAFFVKGDEKYGAKEYEKYLDCYNVEGEKNNGKLLTKTSSIPGVDYPSMLEREILQRFLKHYIWLRHPEIEPLSFDPGALLSSLKRKFEAQYRPYLTSFQGDSFASCFASLRKFLLSEDPDEPIEGYLMKSELGEKESVCFLSMAGSTDPGNLSEGGSGLVYYGSTLCLLKAVEHIESSQNPEAKDFLSPLKGKDIPLYFVLTAETSKILFGEGKLTYEDLKRIYGVSSLRLIPFAKDSSGNPLSPKDSISRSSSPKEKAFANLRSYGEEEEGYSYERCYRFVSELIHALLNRYTRVYLLESSGIPKCKSAFAFFSSFYPSRIKTFTVKSPQDGYKVKDRATHTEMKEIALDSPLPKLSSSPTILEMILKEEKDQSILSSYLEQSLDYDDLEEDTLSSMSKETRAMMKEHDEKRLSKTERVARELAGVYFLLNNGKSELALEKMDFCFESVFGRELGSDRGHGLEAAKALAVGDRSLSKEVSLIDKCWEAASLQKHGKTSFAMKQSHLEALLAFDGSLSRAYQEELGYYKSVKKAFLM